MSMPTRVQKVIYKVHMITSFQVKSKYSTMSKMLGILSTLVTANGRSKLYLKNYIRKAR